jgi:hypothetical protein
VTVASDNAMCAARRAGGSRVPRTDRDLDAPTRTAAAIPGPVRPIALDLAAFGAIALLGLARLATPFTGDQALNVLMGRVIAEGGTPYVDLWDLKHPGIFVYFATAGRLFGFGEIGIHVFELLWMLTLAVVVRAVAGRYLRNRSIATLAPALTVGLYYASTTKYHLTQTEVVVALPLLLSLVFAATSVRPGSGRRSVWLFASGLSTGVVFVFKAPYVVLCGCFLLFALMEWRREHKTTIGGAIRSMAPPLLIGILLPVTIEVVYLAGNPGLSVAWRTFVVHPRQAAAETVLVPSRLFDSSMWFLRTFGVLLALAIVGGWDRLRRGWDMVTASLVAWVAAGSLLVWAQTISWWEYHYLLLIVPLGLLAAQGLEALWDGLAGGIPSRHHRARIAMGITVLLVLWAPQGAEAGRAIASMLRSPPPFRDDASLHIYQADRDQAYADGLAATSFLREPGSHGGPIYVFADPILYHLAGRDPAISLLAPWFHPTSDLWRRLRTELEAAPPPYVFVDEGALEAIIGYNPTMADRIDSLRSWIGSRYIELRSNVGGTWYLRLDLSRGTAP